MGNRTADSWQSWRPRDDATTLVSPELLEQTGPKSSRCLDGTGKQVPERGSSWPSGNDNAMDAEKGRKNKGQGMISISIESRRSHEKRTILMNARRY
jgi:hypothetical protein